MAWFKNPRFFKRQFGPAFDYTYQPGTRVPLSGIFRCTGCGDECACNKGNPLPPQNHHQHRNYYLPIRWQLIVAAEQR
jgi:hypothetical protein